MLSDLPTRKFLQELTYLMCNDAISELVARLESKFWCPSKLVLLANGFLVLGRYFRALLAVKIEGVGGEEKQPFSVFLTGLY